MNCSWFGLESHCLFLVLVSGWYALLQAGRFYCGVVFDIQLEYGTHKKSLRGSEYPEF
jgi:hypothetical protein